MPTFSMICDVKQGFNFEKDKQEVVGFITSLKIGDIQLEAKLTVKDPTAPTTDMAVVSVLSASSWDIGATDALIFNGQVDTKNKQKISLLTIKDLSKIDVLVKFKVYDYDPVAGVYFLCMHSNDVELKGIVEKTDSELYLNISGGPSDAVKSPKNYAFAISISPKAEAQQIHLATSNEDKVAKDWGIKNT